MSQHNRCYYFDYLRAFFVFLVVFDHTIHPYTVYFDRTWFITELDSSYVYDVLHLLCYAIMVPGLFFVSGVFTPHSLKHRGALSYVQERLVRLGIPYVFGLLIFSSFIIFIREVHNGKWEHGFFRFYTEYYFPKNIAATGFWYLSFLFVLTLSYLLLTRVWKNLEGCLGKLVGWMTENPLSGYGAIVFTLSASIIIMEVPFGTWFWFTGFMPYFGAIGSLMIPYIVLFMLGVGMYAHFGISSQKLASFLHAHHTFILISTAITSLMYVGIALTYASDGAFDIQLPIAGFYGTSTAELYTKMLTVPLVNWVRAGLLGCVMFNLLLTSLWSFSRFLNKPIPMLQEFAATSYGIYLIHESFTLSGHTLMYGSEIPLLFRVITLFVTTVFVSWGLVRYVIWQIPGAHRVV